jgi:predicted GTPase
MARKQIQIFFYIYNNAVDLSNITYLILQYSQTKVKLIVISIGETASGKSSLINLLLGGIDLLPTSQLGCTTTICEIRTNKDGRKEAIGYYRYGVTIFHLNDIQCEKK